MTFLADLENLATHLSPSDLPHNENVQQLLGAVVKVLEHQGATVAEDLLPKAAEAELAPEAAAAAAAVGAAPGAVSALHDLIVRAEAAVAELEGKAKPADTPTSSGEGSTPAGASTAAPDAPAAPPIEGAQ
jgi:hypothetical protein